MDESCEESTVSTTYETRYVSCMRINGVPLLPPLMTPEYRREMQLYKRLASAVERRLSDFKLGPDETTVNSNLLPSDSEDWTINLSSISSKDNIPEGIGLADVQPDRDNNEFESMNSQVTVIDNETERSAKPEPKPEGVSDRQNPPMSESQKKKSISPRASPSAKEGVKPDSTSKFIENEKNVKKMSPSASRTISSGASKVGEKAKPIAKDVLKSNIKITKSNAKPSPVNSVKSKKKRINEKENVPQLRCDGKKSILNDIRFQKNPKKSSKGEKLSPSKNATGSLNNISSGLTSPPKLVRQNSYTLEYPSPLLLAHLEERSLASGVDLRSISMSESTSVSFLCDSSKQRSWDSNTAKETWSSIGSDINSISTNEKPEKKVVSKLPKDASVPEPLNKKLENSSPNGKDCLAISGSSSSKLELETELSTSDQTSIKSSIVADYLNKSSVHSDNDVCTEAQTNQDVTSFIFDEDSKLLQDDVSKEVSNSAIEPDGYVNDVLRKIQEDHQKKLADLLKKQEEEQLLLRKEFESQQQMLLSQFNSVAENSNAEQLKNQSEVKEADKREPKVYKEENELNARNGKNNSDIEKYFSMSTDMLNKSRHLLSNNKPQSKLYDRQPDIWNLHDNNKSNDSHKPINIRSNGVNPDKKRIEDSAYFNDAILTHRTNNTLDDVNSTFTSVESELEPVHYRSAKDLDGMTKLKSAFDKISQIQRNLASQAIYRSLPNYDLVDNDRLTNDSSFPDDDSKDCISLSSISMASPRSNPPTVLDRSSLSLNLIDVSRPQAFVARRRSHYDEREIRAASTIVAYAKGYLTRRLMRTEKVQSTVQTIKDALMCALQLHREEGGIRGADVDLHRRLIQQITAACYSLHDIFIASTPTERTTIISQDRERKILLSYRSNSSASSSKQLSATTQRVMRRKMDAMSKSHTGVFGKSSRPKPTFPTSMTRSHYDPSYHIKVTANDRPRRSVAVAGDFFSRKPWR